MIDMDLQKLSHRHDAIAEWLVCNPDKTQRDCAAFFKYTEPWMSQLIHSDMFQALYVKLCEERQVLAVHSVSAKMSAAAALALDRTIERLEAGAQPTDRFLTDTTNGLLDKLGYGKPEAPTQTHQHLHLTADDLRDAANRARVANTSGA